MTERAKVLAVEDEDLLARDLRRRLTNLRYDAWIVGTGQEAVVITATLRPDIVLMDIQLPGGMDGVEAAERIRADHGVPVVFTTSHADPATLGRAKLSEPYGYLVKPFDDRALETTLEMALYKHGAEERLRKVERWLAATLRSIGDAVIATDVERAVTYLNPMAERLTGWPSSEAQGRAFDEVFAARSRATGAPIEDLVGRVLREGVVVDLAPETLLAGRHGRDVSIEDSAAPIRDAGGRITGVVVCFRDVSQRVATEEALRVTEEQLRHSQKLDSLGRMSGGIAHDFNNLLTGIVGFTELALNELPAGAHPRVHLEEVMRCTRRAGELTRQLLAFSRKQVFAPKVVSPNEVVAATERLLARLVGASVSVESVLGAKGTVQADPTQLEQVIVNLAVNARDAMPNGGRLRIETRDVELAGEPAFPDAQAGPYVLVSVADTGCGMDEATLARCFEPFFTTKGPAGNGLGLSTAYGIVRQSGGRLRARSAPGQGTTFEVYLPRVGAGAPTTKEPEAGPTEAGGHETALVCDDDPAVGRLMCSVLRGAGYTVLQAASGTEALLVAAAHVGALDVLVSDVLMPGLDGRQVAERLRASRPDLAVLLVSGHTGTVIQSPDQLPTGAQLLEKPFTPAALRLAVRRALDARSISQRSARDDGRPGPHDTG